MTTLTQLTLDPRHRQVITDLGDTHAMHQRVMSLLPDDMGAPARATTATLYRVEDTPAGTRLLIQSNAELDPMRLPDGYAITVRRTPLDALLRRLILGATVRYRIDANPSKRAQHGPLAGKTTALVGHDDTLTWWHRKAAAAGLTVTAETTRVTELPAHTGKRNGARVHHHAVRFDGIATITDADSLTQALRVGVGRGKAHGLGLLTVVPG